MGASFPEILANEVLFSMEISRSQGKGEIRAGLRRIISRFHFQNTLTWLPHLIYEETKAQVSTDLPSNTEPTSPDP